MARADVSGKRFDRRIGRWCFAGVVLAAVSHLVIQHPPFVAWPFAHTSMLSVHLLLELVAVLIALMVIGVNWFALDGAPGDARSTLIMGFTVVVTCDLVHALTYEGMPALLSEASTPRAIFFWLAGRSAEVLTLGALALTWRWRVSRAVALGVGVMVAGSLVWVGSFALDLVPTTFVQGKGVTGFKAAYEYVLSAANLLVAGLLWRKARASGHAPYLLLATSAFVMSVGELSFTSYVRPSDFQNIFGHLYKVTAYLLLFQATFVVTMRAPFDALRVSERRTAEREEQLASIVASTADAIITLDAQRRIVVFNQAAEALFGVTAQEAASSRLSRFILEATPERVEAFAQGAPSNVVDRVLRTGLRADGTSFLIECSRSKVGSGADSLLITLIRDVSERERVAHEMASAIQRFRTLFYAAPNSAIILAADTLEVRDVNDAAANLHGYTRERVVGLRLRAIGMGLVDKDQARFEEAIRAQGRVINMHVQARVGDGSVRDFLMAVEPIDYDGERCFLLMGQDITERIVAEAALKALNVDLEARVDERTAQLRAVVAELERARDRAESATQAKGEFLANMSHEIRTPINAVIGLTDLALRLAQDPRQHDYLEKSQLAADALLQLVDRVLDFSKIEARRLELEVAPFDLPALVQQVVTIVENRAQAKALALQLKLDPALPAQIMGDVHRLRQVLLNLCSNAVKFTERGSVTLRVEPDRGWPCEPGRMRVRFEVEDTGVGLSAEQVQRVFQPFMQADASTTRKHGGTGLGLSISRQLVELMGGSLSVRSTPGQGSTFGFSIDVALAGGAAPPVPVSAIGSGVHEPDPPPMARLRGRRVLLVEDNELNQLVAGDLLREVAGMEVVIAGHGEAALEALNAGRFDVVMSDVQMPGMDGFELARRIRQRWSADVLPVVAVTAHASVRDKALCLAAGMNDYVTKPFDPANLFRVLASVLNHPEASPPLRADAGTMAASGVAIDLGLERCLGQRALFAKVVRRYLGEQADLPASLRAQIESGHPQAAMTRLHDLVSSAGVVGAMRLSALAQDLHRALEAGQLASAQGLLTAIEAEHQVVRQALETHLADEATA
jgi:PAS domain S-box-containing protein